MKKKDVLTLVVCFVAISGALYFIIKTFFPSSKLISSTTTTTIESVKSNWDIDNQFYEEKINTLRDYGEATEVMGGRANPFGPLN